MLTDAHLGIFLAISSLELTQASSVKARTVFRHSSRQKQRCGCPLLEGRGQAYLVME